MEANEGKIDRIVRVILGIVLAGLGYYFGWWLLYILAAVLVITGLTGFCLIYKLLKFDTLGK